MIMSKLKRWKNTAATRVAAALIGLSAIATAGPAFAQNEDALDWYIFVGRNALENPIVVYFQSEHATPEFTPVGSVAFVINTEYTPGVDAFDPAQVCRIQSLEVSDPTNAQSLRTRIIYGPNSDQGVVSIIDLPSYFAQQTVLSLLQEGVLIDENAATPYFNCAGYTWAQIMSQPPEFWEQLILDTFGEAPGGAQ